MPAGYTSGVTQSLYIKFEAATPALVASSTATDFVGAGKIIDPTSDATWVANRLGIVNDIVLGGDAVIESWREWASGTAKSLVVGEELENFDLTVKANRQLTVAKALEDALTGSPVWGVILRSVTPTESVQAVKGVGAKYTLNPFFGTIASRLSLQTSSASEVMGTLALSDHSKAIDV